MNLYYKLFRSTDLLGPGGVGILVKTRNNYAISAKSFWWPGTRPYNEGGFQFIELSTLDAQIILDGQDTLYDKTPYFTGNSEQEIFKRLIEEFIIDLL